MIENNLNNMQTESKINTKNSEAYKYNSKTEYKKNIPNENNKNNFNISNSLNKISSELGLNKNTNKKLNTSVNLDETIIDANTNIIKNKEKLTSEINTRESLSKFPEDNDKVNYIEFNDLIKLKIDNLSEFKSKLTSKLKNESNWKEQFDALNELRSLNKFQLNIFYIIIEDVIDDLPAISSSVRSCLSKNCFLLICEIFDNLQSDKNKEESVNSKSSKLNKYNNFNKIYLSKLIEMSLKECSNYRKLVRDLASKSLETISEKVFKNICLEKLLSKFNSISNAKHHETSYIYILEFIKNCPLDIMLECINWKKVFDCITYLYITNKKDTILKEVFRLIYEIDARFREVRNFDFENFNNKFCINQNNSINEDSNNELKELLSKLDIIINNKIINKIIKSFYNNYEDIKNLVKLFDEYNNKTNKKLPSAKRISLVKAIKDKTENETIQAKENNEAFFENLKESDNDEEIKNNIINNCKAREDTVIEKYTNNKIKKNN